MSSRNVVVVGAGIGGLTAALALARRAFRVVVLEQSERLEETGAGIQLTPNATRVLINLGLREALEPVIVAPQAIRVRRAKNAAEIAAMPLGPHIEKRYGAPYWVVHRGDLHKVLAHAAKAHPDIVIKLGARVEDFANHPNGVTVEGILPSDTPFETGIALIGADGLWSKVRARLGDVATARFAERSAFRTVIAPDRLAPEFRGAEVNLWLGRDGHVVHYPVRGGSLVNIVAIARDTRRGPGWSAPAGRDEVSGFFPLGEWAAPVRELLRAPDQWLRWALHDRPPLARWGRGAVTLLGDAAHPMVPFLAQGAAMAIEDAAVLSAMLADKPQDVPGALRRYEGLRIKRTADVQRAARRTGEIYHMSGLQGFARDRTMRLLGGAGLLERYDWIYDWRAA